MHRVDKKIRLRCQEWPQVAKLCREHTAGRNLTIRGAFALEADERVAVTLCLPDEMAVAIEAEVLCVRDGPVSGNEFVIHLSGLTPKVCAELQTMSSSSQSGSSLAS